MVGNVQDMRGEKRGYKFMIKVENIDVWGFEHAIRGMRNPMNSWDKSDSGIKCVAKQEFREPASIYSFVVGENDLGLMRKLYKAGTEHRKYLRQIFVSLDITAPLYWWKEFDTYKVGTVANSCSTMHKIAAKEFELDDFSHEHLLFDGKRTLLNTIEDLNRWRRIYLNGDIFALNGDDVVEKVEPKDKRVWWQMIQLLPSSYNQKRTITMNYENAITMIRQRTGHKLDEWNTFVEFLKTLPYIKEIEEWD